MTNKIIAIQGNHPSKLNPLTDTSIFLAYEIQKKNYKRNTNPKSAQSKLISLTLTLMKATLTRHEALLRAYALTYLQK